MCSRLSGSTASTILLDHAAELGCDVREETQVSRIDASGAHQRGVPPTRTCVREVPSIARATRAWCAGER